MLRMMEPLAAPPLLGRTVGRYALFDEIAAGGMATVHLGRLMGQVGFSRTVAIKRLHPHFAKDPDFVSMFLDEARLVGRIRHPNVVPTLDVVQEDGELLLVMEYVQGESFSKLLRRSRSQAQPPPIPIVATVLVGVLHGLHAAHEARGENGESLQIVHRDVSPQNILVGTDGVARLLDFGAAKAAQRSQTTQGGQLKGKLAYMSPEQVSCDEIDRRCDVFAAGVVLWEALSGKRLFEADNDARVMKKVLSGEIPPPSSIAAGVSPRFDEICARALSRDRTGRYATARDMALAIEKASSLATASEVGSWVEQVAHDAIALRAARVTEVESRSDIFVKGSQPADIEVTLAEDPPVAPTPPRRTLAIVALALLLLGVAASAGFALARVEQTPPARDLGARSAEAPVAVPTTPMVPSPPLVPPIAPSASAAPAPAAPVAKASTTPAPQTPPAAAAKPIQRTPVPPAAKPHTVDCAQPFAIDADGVKHVRPECL
jgi:eukaryotic-like serine/threonine-protein kinase